MTKKDYIAIGKIISHVKSRNDRDSLIIALGSYFQSDNPSFNRDKFNHFVLDLIDKR